MQVAGARNLIERLLKTGAGKAMLSDKTREVARAAAPGAVLSSAFTAIGGGGIPATIATGALDMGLSTAGGRLAGKVTPETITRLVGQGPKRQAVANFLAGAKPGEMSTLQNLAMGVGSVGASMAALPLYPSQQIVAYNPTGAAGFFKKMLESNAQEPPQFLSTHPNSDNRVEAMTEHWQSLGGKTGQTFEERYKAKLKLIP